ncbi:hypothetical protein [Phosphitispora sp. TUW77]|uniref:hypothetical protein n=1 Tax=Phosphitispora sp. TUW77 TaxID=3152361 RepID=UPI003AB75C7D
MFFRNKPYASPEIRKQTIAVWSPGGNNTSVFSLSLAKNTATYISTFLIELPCLGIPRLAIESGHINRTSHVDAALLEYERKGSSPIDFCIHAGHNLALLAANPYALPDHPAVHKISSPETLEMFPEFCVVQARKSGYQVVIFDCQGVLASPMTFYSLRLADTIVLVVERPSDIAWALLNKKRLIEGYNIASDAFAATALNDMYLNEIREVLECPVLPIDKLSTLAVSEKAKPSPVLHRKQVVIT